MGDILTVPGHELGDVALAVRAADLLNKHYPGHLWAVTINDEPLGGYMLIKNFAISEKLGMKIGLPRVYADPDLKCVMRAGGEYLERAGMIRGWWNGQDATRIDGAPERLQPWRSARR